MDDIEPVDATTITLPLRLRIDTDTANLAPVRRAVERLATSLRFDERTSADIGLCVNEAMANVIRHAYGGAMGQAIEIEADVSGDVLEIRMRDWGSGIVPPPAPDEDPDPLRPGGLGLICLSRKMDHVVFEPQPDGMLLRLGKRLNRNAGAKVSGEMIQLRNSTDLITSARQEGDAIVVAVRGEVDLHNSPQLRTALFELLERPGVKKLILNVGQVPYVDSSAIAVLVEAIRKLRETQGKLYLTQLQPRVQSVMEVTRLGSLIGLAESDAAALAM